MYSFENIATFRESPQYQHETDPPKQKRFQTSGILIDHLLELHVMRYNAVYTRLFVIVNENF